VHAEQILVMSAGEIVERGTHEQLIALQGQYAQMWSMQQQESEPLLAEVTPTGA
jgi:ATP-binding cassette subfamily B protein